jgi:hypothetical protein
VQNRPCMRLQPKQLPERINYICNHAHHTPPGHSTAGPASRSSVSAVRSGGGCFFSPLQSDATEIFAFARTLCPPDAPTHWPVHSQHADHTQLTSHSMPCADAPRGSPFPHQNYLCGFNPIHVRGFQRFFAFKKIKKMLTASSDLEIVDAHTVNTNYIL